MMGFTILQGINNELSGDVKKFLTNFVFAVLSPSEYFATKINKAITGKNEKIMLDDGQKFTLVNDDIIGDKDKVSVTYKGLYNDVKVSKLINNIMLDGKKGVAQKICYDAFDIIKERTGSEPIEVFYKALENVMPVLECKARRVGGANYQVPLEVRPARRQTLGLRWIVMYARQRSERTMKERLAAELIDASNETGGAFKKKEDMHKMADANRAFANYRW